MTLVPASALCATDWARLGNNLRGRVRKAAPRHRARRRLVAAVNRSLAGLHERVRVLDSHPSAAA